jgi:branched-chain amino acid transport system substrate-binding protein
MNSKWLLKIVVVLAVSLLATAGCVAAPAPPPAAPAPTVAPTEAAAVPVEATEAPTEEAAAPVANQGEPYKIGLFFSVTGPASSLGVPERDTAMMLVEQVNKAGGLTGPDGKVHPIQAFFEDDQTDSTKAVLAVKKLIEENGAPIVIGGTGSPASVAVIDTVTEAKIPFISMAAASAIVQPVEERYWVFKTPQTNLPVAEVQADWMEAKGITKIASLGVNNAFGADSIDAMKQVVAERGFQVVYEGTYEPGDTDFSAQLTQVAGSGAEVLIAHATPAEGAPLTVQFRDFGLDIPIMHNHGIGNAAFIELAGNAAEGVLFPIGKLLVAQDLPDSDPQKAVLMQYIADYAEYTGGGLPSTFGGHAWDGLKMAFAALQAVGPEPAAIRDYLEGIHNFIGISGVFNVSPTDHNGIGKESLVLVEIKDGKWVYIPPEGYKDAP